MSKKDTGAGKGDKLRRGITQNEWNKKWEKIFGKNQENAKKYKWKKTKPRRKITD